MKRTLLFMVCMVVSLTMFAQESDYRPLVEEGKHWTYDNFLPMRPAEYDHYYYYDLKGDTLIAGQQCLKIYSDNRSNDNVIRYEGALYEVDKKVYCFFPEKDKAELLYDFNCAVGDTLHVWAVDMVVKAIQTEDDGGIAIKRYTLCEVNDILDFSWIEGVGSELDFFALRPAAGNNCHLTACDLNGETIYKYSEPELTDKGYHKMGIEGKRWNYIRYHLEDDGWHEDPYSYVVKGDTIIRRTTYKNLYYQDENTERFECLLLEIGRTVYKNTDLGNNSYDSPILKTFFEFDREDFGRVFTWKSNVNAGNTNWMVYGVDTIEVNNCQFRRYTCLQKYSEEGDMLTTIEYGGEGVWNDIWVEGIGSASSGIEDQYPNHEPPVRATSDYSTFVSCYENGECIFSADDFNDLINPNPDYHPFIEDGKVWAVKVYPDGYGMVRDDTWTEHYYFDGDTIIGGQTCKKMFYITNADEENWVNGVFTPASHTQHYIGNWYEQDKKVYFAYSNRQQFELIYDFTLSTGDSIQDLAAEDRFWQVTKMSGGIPGFFKGTYYNLSLDGRIARWLEGVGNESWPYVYQPWELCGATAILLSCRIGDEVIYYNSEVEDPYNMEARKHRFDFTHTIKTQPKAPIKRENSDACISSSEREVARPEVKAPIKRENSDACISSSEREVARPEVKAPIKRENSDVYISSSEREVARQNVKAPMRRESEQSLYGEYSDLLLGIHLDPLDDAYLVSITNESGQVVYEKAINADNIVGLNIDISAYAKGRYTVTIENNSESFTGQFETQTAVIETISHQASAVKHHIYNLQGQRLSSLQKGLNIVNGQKIYVK